jgi:hypothetical protein
MKVKRQRVNFVLTAIAALVLSGPPVMAGDKEGEDPAEAAANQATQDAQLVKMQQLAAIAADRQGVIDSIVAAWRPFAESEGYSDGWQEEFEEGLNALSDTQLAAVQNAGSYREVTTIMQGNDPADAQAGSDELSGVQNLGSNNDNLVLWPVDPCRVFDTRNTGAGRIGAGTSRAFQVRGNGATISAQGGNPAGCPAPNGEPSGVVVNVTSTGQPATGFLTVYPFASPRPNSSLVNFTRGISIANSTVQKTCFNCGSDIRVYAGGSSSEVIGDVLGYFYAVSEDDFRVRFAGSESGSTTNLTIAGGCTNYSNGEVTITVPRSGKITVNAQAVMRLSSHTFGDDDEMRIYIGDSATDCTSSDGAQGYRATRWEVARGHASWANGQDENTMSVSRTFTVTPGTHTYYLNGERNDGTGTGGFWYAAMQATFYPNP